MMMRAKRAQVQLLVVVVAVVQVVMASLQVKLLMKMVL